MSDADLVVVHTFASQLEADLARSALEAAGIDAVVQSDTAGGEYPGVAVGRGFKIVVRGEDEPTSREILELPARESSE